MVSSFVITHSLALVEYGLFFYSMVAHTKGLACGGSSQLFATCSTPTLEMLHPEGAIESFAPRSGASVEDRFARLGIQQVHDEACCLVLD
jgi:hypothetical protein